MLLTVSYRLNNVLRLGVGRLGEERMSVPARLRTA